MICKQKYIYSKDIISSDWVLSGNFSGNSAKLCWTLPSLTLSVIRSSPASPQCPLCCAPPWPAPPISIPKKTLQKPNPYILSVLRFNQVICVFCFTYMQIKTTHNSKMKRQCCPCLHSWEEPMSFFMKPSPGSWASSDKLQPRITRGKSEEEKWGTMRPPERWQIQIRAEV